MENEWFERTKVVAYYLWECSDADDALSLWYAAEDIASFFEQSNILDVRMVDGIKQMGHGSEGYVWFVRHIAYRMYIHTNNPNDLDNWFLSERVLEISDWIENVIAMAEMLSRDSENAAQHVRSDSIRSFYESCGK